MFMLDKRLPPEVVKFLGIDTAHPPRAMGVSPLAVAGLAGRASSFTLFGSYELADSSPCYLVFHPFLEYYSPFATQYRFKAS